MEDPLTNVPIPMKDRPATLDGNLLLADHRTGSGPIEIYSYRHSRSMGCTPTADGMPMNQLGDRVDTTLALSTSGEPSGLFARGISHKH
jgi:hypothetical protein